MKRTLAAGAAICLVAGLGFATAAAPAQAAAKYGSCASLKKEYPDGVASSGSAAASAVKKGFLRPAVDKAAFNANKKLGRGGAGFVCATRAPEPTPTPAAPQPITLPVRILLHKALLIREPEARIDIANATRYCVAGQSGRELWKDGVGLAVKDATGAIIATTSLGAGTASNPVYANKILYDAFGRYVGLLEYHYYDCEWTSSVTMLPSTFYTISLPPSTNTPLSPADIATDGNTIFIEYDYTG